MQKLIVSWFSEANRLKKSIRADKLAGRNTQTARLLQQVWTYCARELASANTFKFAVGDEVILPTGKNGLIIERKEYLSKGQLERKYLVDCLNNNNLLFLFKESELLHHRPNQGQTRARPRGRAK